MYRREVERLLVKTLAYTNLLSVDVHWYRLPSTVVSGGSTVDDQLVMLRINKINVRQKWCQFTGTAVFR